MKTSLRSYIFFFLLLILAIMSLSIFIFFRFSARQYIDAVGRQQVNQDLRTAKTLLNKTDIKPADNFPNNIMLFNHSQELIHPQKPSSKVKELSEKFTEQYFIKADITDETPFILSTETRDYLLSVLTLDSSNPYDVAYAISYTNLYKDESLLRQVENLILIITLILAFIFIPILWFLSGCLVSPLRQLTHYSAQLSSGNFTIPQIHSPILEIENLAKTFTSMARSLDKSIEAQKTFFQNASHELRTPLMSIEGYAQGIQDGIFPDPAIAADIIIAESEHMKLLVDGILTLARLDAREQEIYLTSIDIHEFLSQLIERLQGIAISRKRTIIFEAESDDLFIYADPILLEKACSNLLSNALQHAKQNIYIKLNKVIDHIVIAIENDGPMLNEADIPRLFQRFYKGKTGNFGIGLSIVKSAVEYIGGTVKAENGRFGACFTITLTEANKTTTNKTALSHD